VTDLARAPGDAGADRRWLGLAIELSERCERSGSAFSVGAILVAARGDVIATGWSREAGPADHAEEVALRRATGAAARPDLADGGDLRAATLYSSLEPCGRRSSRPASCAELIVAAGVRRVVIAWREPPVFQPGGGADWLTEQGVTVVEVPGLEDAARAVNAHLLRRTPAG
jgi:diaminohydroxyphosphoribosylaminopyrimidine deaminase / 5-amino-6-(5-phosphoribosylamino)uracil reductase